MPLTTRTESLSPYTSTPVETFTFLLHILFPVATVYMTNFALILNDLAASFEGRNEYISRLCRYPLLILDDFGMERGTEYGLEQRCV